MNAWVLRILGIVCVALGFLGAVLPLLPTTPFLLLALFLFSKSSPQLHYWLLHHPWFGSTLQDYIKYKAVKKKTRWLALCFLWVSLAFSAWWVPLWPIRFLLLTIGIAVTVHLLRMKSLPLQSDVDG